VSDESKVKIFSSNDNDLKLLGELLSNDSSRSIIRLLIDKEMYTNEIATKLDMRVSLVIHHLKKLEELGLLELNRKKIVKKGNDHRFFRMKSNIFIFPNNSKEEIEEKGLLQRIFKESVKFASIGIAAVAVWFTDIANYGKTKEVYPVPFGETLPSDPLVPALLVVICGLVMERIFGLVKKKKRG